jgi:hypothetical protein
MCNLRAALQGDGRTSAGFYWEYVEAAPVPAPEPDKIEARLTDEDIDVLIDSWIVTSVEAHNA